MEKLYCWTSLIEASPVSPGSFPAKRDTGIAARIKKADMSRLMRCFMEPPHLALKLFLRWKISVCIN
jgi:hypothetical protein